MYLIQERDAEYIYVWGDYGLGGKEEEVEKHLSPEGFASFPTMGMGKSKSRRRVKWIH